MFLWMHKRSLFWKGDGIVRIKSPYGEMEPLPFQIKWHIFFDDSSLQIQQTVLLQEMEIQTLLLIIPEGGSGLVVSLVGEGRPRMLGYGSCVPTQASWTLQEEGNKEVTGQERHWRDEKENCYFEAYYGSREHRTEVQGIWRADILSF